MKPAGRSAGWTPEHMKSLQQYAGNRALQIWLKQLSGSKAPKESKENALTRILALWRLLQKSVLKADERVQDLRKYKSDSEPEIGHLLRQSSEMQRAFGEFLELADRFFGKRGNLSGMERESKLNEAFAKAGRVLLACRGVEARCERVSRSIGAARLEPAVGRMAVPQAVPLPVFLEQGLSGGQEEVALKPFLSAHPEYHVTEIRSKTVQGTTLRLYKQYIWTKGGRPPAVSNISNRPAAASPVPDGWVEAKARKSTAENLAEWLDRGKMRFTNGKVFVKES
ncbi:hypothetical protein LJK87_10995 [Paenibacillus sp. P25]|nr:hypothetical protein LJK87_10995 [Paenibacillus sp. P25]